VCNTLQARGSFKQERAVRVLDDPERLNPAVPFVYTQGSLNLYWSDLTVLWLIVGLE